MIVQIEALGDTIVERDLLRVGSRSVNAAPAFFLVADMLRNISKKQFEQQGGLGPSGKWAPLADSTVQRKAAQGLRPEILRATDALFKSLTDPSAEFSIEHITGESLHYGSELRYGVFHQKGTRNMPRRRIVDLSETAKRNTAKIIQTFIMTGELRKPGQSAVL